MRTTINILGIKFDNVSMDEAVEIGLSLFEKEAKYSIYTPNPEIVMAAYDNKILQNQLNDGALCIPDGIGVVIGSKIIGKPLKERVAGYDFNKNMFERLKNTDKTVYFYGSAPGVAKLAAKKMMEEFKGLNIVGIWNGYEKDNSKVIDNINMLNPDLLLVGLGAPRQEEWISMNMDKINAKVFVGVGGSFDGFAGKVLRSPDIFIKLNLEWLHRLIKQPSRWKRMLQLPRFLVKMLVEGRRYK